MLGKSHDHLLFPQTTLLLIRSNALETLRGIMKWRFHRICMLWTGYCLEKYLRTVRSAASYRTKENLQISRKRLFKCVIYQLTVLQPKFWFYFFKFSNTTN